MTNLENLFEFIETLFYGSSNFGNYNSGINIEKITPEIHKKYFGVGFSDIDIDGN